MPKKDDQPRRSKFLGLFNTEDWYDSKLYRAWERVVDVYYDISLRFRLIEIDSWLDWSTWRFGRGVVEFYRGLIRFFSRFRLRGAKRGAVEVLDEMATLGTAGMLLLLTFALPAFEATKTDWLKQIDYSVTFLDRFGNEIGKRGILHNDAVPLDELPDALVKSALATEDRRFYDHFGIDLFGTARAIVENARHKSVVQGGSTITQQLAKNLFLTNERSLERKVKEAFLALWLEANLSKREILKLYLDRAYMGGGTFGAAAASEFYFGKSVRDLSLAESAMLAGLFKAPTKYAPHVNLPAARARANEVLTNLVQANFMTEGQVVGARRQPATPIPRADRYSPDYFLDFAFGEVQTLAPRQSVLTVRTTLDLALQRKAEEAIESMLRQYGEEFDVGQAAALVLDPDGSIRAMVGGRDYGASQFNRVTSAARQPGSSFKPFVYAAALVNGYKETSIVNDTAYCIGDWCPKNYSGGFSGRMTLTTALTHSINSIPVQLAHQIGREKVAEIIRPFGVRLAKKPDWPFVLGAIETTIHDITGGYAAFANGGMQTTPFAIERIQSNDAGPIYDRARSAPLPKRILPADKAAELNRMLASVVANGTGRRAMLDGITVAGKTGTTSSYRDAWFVGFTGNYVGAVWVGNDDYKALNKVTGGMLPAMTWKEIMAFAHTNIELKPLFGTDKLPPAAPLVADKKPATATTPQTSALAGLPPPQERPRALSARTVGVLEDIETQLRTAKPLTVAPAGLTSLQPGRGGLTTLSGSGAGGLSVLR